MEIYEAEKRDGLSELLLSTNSVGCCGVARCFDPSKEQQESMKIVASDGSENKDQMDLFYLESVLVSTGWNKNDDVFDPQETWAAKATPEDKPFNFMHDEKDIIGHITGNSVVDFEGVAIAEQEDPPSEFNILTTAVIYKEWSDIEQKQRIHKILAEIEEGKWFVSMECLFPNFDYALLDERGGTKVVPRSEASAFLTKHLRSYGGSGKYEDYRVGRLLRNLAFSGKGLVSKPANPRSVILEGNRFFDESEAQILTISSTKENDMSENDKQIEDLRAELAEAKTANEALKEKVVAEQQAEFESKIQALENTISETQAELTEKSSECETLTQSLTEAQETIVAKEKDVKEKEEAMKDMKKEADMMKRKAQLEGAGLDSEAVASALDSFDEVSEEAFEAVVAMLKKQAEAAMPPELKEAIEKKKNEKKEKEAKAEEELDSAEASEETLDNVEESQESSIAELDEQEDPAESLRSVASEWLGSCLQTVPKQNK